MSLDSNFADIAAPLTDLTKKTRTHRVVGPIENKMLSQLSKKLKISSSFAGLLWDRGSILKTDASGLGWGRFLSPVEENNEEHTLHLRVEKLQTTGVKN